ncbi:MAG: polymer-forming cytoskeletal protein [Patescibacteria group bacterium]|nr:polymer-forming cytoskeletal protein [Patescibacteria group bacterium]
MFKSQDEKEKIKEVETIIGPSIKVKGNFNGQGNIVVEGILEGSLKTNGDVFIGDKAKIAAIIEAREARIGGEITGNIKIKKHMEVVASARIFGDVECASLSVERGAVLNGKCTMLPERKDEIKS